MNMHVDLITDAGATEHYTTKGKTAFSPGAIKFSLEWEFVSPATIQAEMLTGSICADTIVHEYNVISCPEDSV